MEITRNPYHRTGDEFMDYPSLDVKRTGRRLRYLCQLRGKTIGQLEQYMGLSSPRSIYRWFRGTTLPTVDNLYALSDFLGVGVDELLVGNRGYGRERQQLAERMVLYYMGCQQSWQGLFKPEKKAS